MTLVYWRHNGGYTIVNIDNVEAVFIVEEPRPEVIFITKGGREFSFRLSKKLDKEAIRSLAIQFAFRAVLDLDKYLSVQHNREER